MRIHAATDLVIDVGDVDGAADDLVPLRHGGAAVGPAPAGVAVAAEASCCSPLLLQRPGEPWNGRGNRIIITSPHLTSPRSVDIGNRGGGRGQRDGERTESMVTLPRPAWPSATPGKPTTPLWPGEATAKPPLAG